MPVKRDAAFKAFLHFFNIILEAPERGQAAVKNHNFIPDKPDAMRAGNPALRHNGAANAAGLGPLPFA